MTDIQTSPTTDAKLWMTAQEIAEAGLPDMPATERAIQLMARREGWNEHPLFARKRVGVVGGGFEYHYCILPTLAQIAYVQRHLRELMPAREELVPEEADDAELTDRARLERDARLALVAAFNRYSTGLNLRRKATLKSFADKYNAQSLPVDEWVRETVPTVSPRTLTRWLAAKKRGSIGKLAVDRGANRRGSGLLPTANDGRVKTFILALIAQNPQMSAEKVRTLCLSEFGETLIDGHGRTKAMPPVRTFQHSMKALKQSEKVLLTKLSNPDVYRSTMAPSGVRSLTHIQRPNALWQIDASPLDAMDTSGSRPTLYACVDIATRRAVLYISRTPNAKAVGLLIRKAILAWGVPEVIKTDNGSDFVAEATKRLLGSLDVQLELSAPYQPQQKGHVERLIRTVQGHFAELLPGFIGHSVTDRKRLEDRKSFAQRLGATTAEVFGVSLTMGEIQDMADRWADIHYNQKVHSALNGLSPNEAAAASPAPIKTADVRALDVLLMPVAGKDGYRKVSKFGIKIDKGVYRCFKALPEDRVFVRMDPNDYGLAYVFDADSGLFIEPAICPERAGVDPVELNRLAKRVRSEFIAENSREISAEIRRITSGAPLIERYLAEKERTAPDRGENVLALPKREITHTTPDLDAALHVATGEAVERPEPAAPLAEASADIVPIETRRPVNGDTRPRFQSDIEMAGWLIANPDKVTDRDRSLMSERLNAWTFRELLSGSGIDPDTLSQLVTPPKRPKKEA